MGATEARILFVFDPRLSETLLVAGDKASNWSGWYRHAIPYAEQLYETYPKVGREDVERGTSRLISQVHAHRFACRWA